MADHLQNALIQTAQATARSGIRLGGLATTNSNPIIRAVGVASQHLPGTVNKGGNIVPTNPIVKHILGQNVQSYANEAKQHGGGLPGLVAAGGSVLGDAAMGGGAKGNLAKDLAKATKVADVTSIMNKAKIHPDVIKLTAPSIAKATKPADVNNILQATHDTLGLSMAKTAPSVTQPTQGAKVGSGLSKAELANLEKQNFTPDIINKLHTDAGGKLKGGVPVAADAKPPKIASTPAAKVGIKAPPKNPPMMVPQVSAEGKLSKLTSLQNRLTNLGDSGKAALQTIRNQIVSNRQYVQQYKDMAAPFYKLTPEEQAVAIKVHKGTAKTNDSAVQAGANALKDVFQHIHTTATSKGLKVGNLGPNYFPDTFPNDWFNKPENFNKAAQDLVASGKAKNLEDAVTKLNKVIIQGSTKPHEFGNFMTREKNLPTGIENADVVTNYIKGASNRISQAEHFGAGGQALNKHVADAVAKGEDAGALKSIISSYINPAKPKPGKLTTGLNAYQKTLRVLQLPRAAVSHAPQGFTNTASDVGYTKYFKSLGSKMFKDPETERLVAKSGVNAEDFGKTDNLSGKATAPGLAPMLRFHRDVAFRGGMSLAKGLAKKGDAAGLAKLGVDGNLAKDANGAIKLSDEQLIKAGHFEADKSIGSHNLIESPAWTQTNGGKLIGMYRKMYTFKQAERIANLFKDARGGNVAPLARFLTLGAPVAGLTVAVAKDEIKDPGSNPLNDKRKLALDTLHNSGIGSIGYGAVDSAINGISHNYGNDSRWSNLAGAISPGAGFAVQTGQNLAKASHGNTKPLEREGLRMVPVGGTALANKFAPSTYTPPDPNAPATKSQVIKDSLASAKVNLNGQQKSWNSLKDAQKKQLAQTDPQAKELYLLEAKMSKALTAPGVYPDGVSPESAHILDRNARLSDRGKLAVNSREPDYEYKLHLAEYERNKANGKLSPVDDQKAQDKLAKDQVGAAYPSQVRGLYGESKAKIYSYITTNPDGNALADQLAKYDQALKDAGMISTLKFKTGFAPKIATGSSGKRGSGTKAKVASLKVRLPRKPKAVKIGRMPASPKAPKKVKFTSPKLAKVRVKKVNLG
jgi:hypothetical protein